METTFDEVFAASYARIMSDGAYNPEFIAHFYELFLASSSDIAARFANTNMSRQKTMLHDSLSTLVDFNAHHKLTPQMQRLALVHGPGAANIPPALYELWLNSLLATVGQFDNQFDATVELAWRLTLAPGISYLQFTYEHPPE